MSQAQLSIYHIDRLLRRTILAAGKKVLALDALNRHEQVGLLYFIS